MSERHTQLFNEVKVSFVLILSNDRKEVVFLFGRDIDFDRFDG